MFTVRLKTPCCKRVSATECCHENKALCRNKKEVLTIVSWEPASMSKASRFAFWVVQSHECSSVEWSKNDVTLTASLACVSLMKTSSRSCRWSSKELLVRSMSSLIWKWTDSKSFIWLLTLLMAQVMCCTNPSGISSAHVCQKQNQSAQVSWSSLWTKTTMSHIAIKTHSALKCF